MVFKLFRRQKTEESTYWQNVFSRSRINGASYNEEELPKAVWEWPTDTYMRRRLEARKKRRGYEESV